MPPAIEKPNPLPPFTRSMSTLFGEAGGRFRLIFNFTIFPAFFNASTAVACVTLTTVTSFTYCLPKFLFVLFFQINKEKEIALNIVIIFFSIDFQVKLLVQIRTETMQSLTRKRPSFDAAPPGINFVI